MSFANDAERLMLDLVNTDRAAAGLRPLRLEQHLNDAADAHSRWMLASGVLSYDGPSGETGFDRMVAAGFRFAGAWSWGENVVWTGSNADGSLLDEAQRLYASVMASGDTASFVLGASYTHAGFGIEEGTFNGVAAVMLTQNFASTAGPVLLDTGPAPAPAPNAAPQIAVDRIKVGANKAVALKPHVDVTDADGDAAVRFRIRDTDGTDSIRFGKKLIDADPGFTFKAVDLGKISIHGEAPGDREVIRIKVFDGQDWSGWERLVVKTRGAPEPARDPAPEDNLDDAVSFPPAPTWPVDGFDFA